MPTHLQVEARQVHALHELHGPRRDGRLLLPPRLLRQVLCRLLQLRAGMVDDRHARQSEASGRAAGERRAAAQPRAGSTPAGPRRHTAARQAQEHSSAALAPPLLHSRWLICARCSPAPPAPPACPPSSAGAPPLCASPAGPAPPRGAAAPAASARAGGHAGEAADDGWRVSPGQRAAAACCG